jgi:DNA-binding MarR family transcriptional regulator
MDATTKLIDEVRLLFHRLVEVTDELHVDLDVVASERAVLESLHREGASTVPDIARARGVTRQHIQTIVNRLLDEGRVVSAPNPAHRRSSLIDLTVDGRTLIDEVLRRERSYLEHRAEPVGERALLDAAIVLADLRRRI